MKIGEIEIGDIKIESWDTDKKIYKISSPYGKFHIKEDSLNYQIGLMIRTMIAHGNKNLESVE